MDTKLTGKTRIESDLIGAREIPAEALYGVQTLRGIENFSISKFRLSEYPLFIKGLAITKMAAAMANFELGLLTVEQKDAIIAACGDYRWQASRPVPGGYDPRRSGYHYEYERE